LHVTPTLANKRFSSEAAPASNLPKNRTFLTQTTLLDRAGSSGFIINVVAKVTGVGQIILDRFSEAAVHTGLMSFGQMACGKYKRHTERGGERLGGEYQGNAQVPEKSDVSSSFGHAVQQKHIPASLYSLVMITGGTGNLPDYFQNMPSYSVVRPLSGVNRFQHFVSKKEPILEPHQGRQPMKSGEI